ncbi:MAG: hypothetical protein ACYSUI_19060, partial [Planctomycetota bacterium]
MAEELSARQINRIMRIRQSEGMSQAEAVRSIQQDYGVKPDGFSDVAATPSQAEEHDERVIAGGEISHLNTQASRLFGRGFAESDAVDILDNGLQFNAAVRDAMDREFVDPDRYAQFWNRAQNLGELTFGSLALAANRIQQANFALQAGEGLAAAKARLLPEVLEAPGVSAARPELEQSMEALDQVAELSGVAKEGGATVGEVYQAHALDVEPFLFEQMENDITAEQLLDAQVGAGTVDQFLVDHRSIGVPLLATTTTINEVFNDPLFLFELAPRLVAQAGKLPTLFGKKAVWQGPRGQLPDLVQASGKQSSRLADAKSAAAADPHNQELFQKFIQADKRMAELDVATAMRKGNMPSMTEPKSPPRRNPESIFIGGESSESARRKVTAEVLASKEEVAGALEKEGFSGLRDFKKRLTAANKALREEAEFAAEHSDTFNAFERLPENVKRHLDVRGWSRERLMRRRALERP